MSDVTFIEDENLHRDRMRARKAARIARYLADCDWTYADVCEKGQDGAWRDQISRLAVHRVSSPHTWSMVIGFLEATTDEIF